MMYATRFHKIALYFVLTGFICACASTTKKDMAEATDVAPTLAETTQYIPVQKFDDKTSTYLPYEPKANPYLAMKGRIKKEAVAKYIEARRLFRAEKYDACKKALNEIIAIDDKLSGPFVMLGDIAVQKGDMQGAVEYFEKAISTNDKNINAYIKLAHAKRVLGEFLAAQNTYAEVLALWPDFPEAHLNLGVLYDVYLNHPLRAQKHMEAYQFLTGGDNAEVAVWLVEIQSRTGVKPGLIGDKSSVQVQK